MHVGVGPAAAAAAAAPQWAEPPPYRVSSSGVKLPTPAMFSGDNEQQNSRVESWVLAVDDWLRLSGVEQELWFDFARALLTTDGSAREWVRLEELDLRKVGKAMTWEYLANGLVAHYAPTVGNAALEVEWAGLRMGTRSTTSVKAYTDRFVALMRRLVPEHTRDTGDLLVRQRYLQGIELGYRRLYREMLGGHSVLSYNTLSEAIAAAEVAESRLHVALSRERQQDERGAYAQSSAGGSRRGYGRNSSRASTESLNGLEGHSGDDGDADAGATAPRWSQLNGFRYDPDAHQDGRYRLSEREARMLYGERRCFRCHQLHPVGFRAPPCPNLPAKSAPKPLRSSN